MASFAQTRQIKGKVTDDADIPLRGVSVLLSGSKKGVQTDAGGNFKIDAPGTGSVTLIITYTGYKAINIITDGSSDVSAKLEKDVAVLEDVVVVGYSTIRRKDLTGSVSSVNSIVLDSICSKGSGSLCFSIYSSLLYESP